MHGAVGVDGEEGEVVAHTARDAEVVGVGGVFHVVLAVEHEEAHATFAFHGEERVGLQVGVAARCRGAGEIGGELS